MAGKLYSVYRLTSPSGRTYVGYTGQTVAERWRQHVQHARRSGGSPIRDAIRKHGACAFSIETLSVHEAWEEALDAEKAAIASEPNPYNVSEGGEGDIVAAHARLRELLTDPEWRARYSANLSAALKASPYRGNQGLRLKQSVAKWRADNPKAAYKLAMRALRMGGHAPKPKAPGGRLPRKRKGAAAKLHKSRRSAEAARKHWAEMHPEKRQSVHAKIAESVTKHHASKTAQERAARDAQLTEARKNIDHDIRKARQKEALAAYWTPERKAEASRVRKERYAALPPEEKAKRAAQLAAAKTKQQALK